METEIQLPISESGEPSGEPDTFYLNPTQFEQKFGKDDFTLGKGSFGSVYQTDKMYAVKRTSKKVCLIDGVPKDYLLESVIMKFLDHPNIVKVRGVTFDSRKCEYSIAMGLAGNTLDVVMKDRGIMPIIERKYILYQIFRALAYCHARTIWHRDIKPDNVLIFSDDSFKLVDFGLAEIFAFDGVKQEDIKGSPMWMAPELLLYDLNYNETIDIWATGIIMFEMITGKEPFYTATSISSILFQMFELIGTPNEQVWPGLTQLPNWDKYKTWPQMDGKLTDVYKTTNATPEEVYLLQHMLTWKNKRLSALQILRNPYFNAVRMMVSSKIPAPIIRRFNCGEWMIQHQIPIPATAGNIISSIKERISSFDWLMRLINKLNLNSRTAFMAHWIYDMYGSMTEKIEIWNLQLLIITSVLIASKIRGTKSPHIKVLEGITEKHYTGADIINMEERILQTLDFNLVVPLSRDFVHYLLGDYIVKIKGFVYNTLLLLMINYNWVVSYGQYGLARTAFNLAMKKYKLTSDVCVRLLPHTKTVPYSDINQFLVTNWDLLTYHSTYRMIANILRSVTNRD